MGTSTIVGICLITAGFADCAVAMCVLGPRIRDARRRNMIVMAVVSGGAMMILLGGAIAGGVLRFDAPA